MNIVLNQKPVSDFRESYMTLQSIEEMWLNGELQNLRTGLCYLMINKEPYDIFELACLYLGWEVNVAFPVPGHCKSNSISYFTDTYNFYDRGTKYGQNRWLFLQTCKKICKILFELDNEQIDLSSNPEYLGNMYRFLGKWNARKLPSHDKRVGLCTNLCSSVISEALTTLCQVLFEHDIQGYIIPTSIKENDVDAMSSVYNTLPMYDRRFPYGRNRYDVLRMLILITEYHTHKKKY